MALLALSCTRAGIGTTPKLISHEVVKERVNHYKITGEKGTNYFANGLLNGDRHCPKNICLKEVI